MKNLSKKILLCLLVALISFSFAFGKGSDEYLKGLDNLAKFLQGNPNYSYVIFPPEIKAGMKNPELNEALTPIFEEFAANVAVGGRVNYSVLDCEPLGKEDKETLRDILDEIITDIMDISFDDFEEVGVSQLSIAEAYFTDVELYYGEEIETAELVTYKANGEWFVYWEDLFYGSDEGDDEITSKDEDLVYGLLALQGILEGDNDMLFAMFPPEVCDVMFSDEFISEYGETTIEDLGLETYSNVDFEVIDLAPADVDDIMKIKRKNIASIMEVSLDEFYDMDIEEYPVEKGFYVKTLWTLDGAEEEQLLLIYYCDGLWFVTM